ncbi:MAG: transcriptional repressor NrdR [SAR202 cluster bacterium]|nr:transcriptional repressor NrdR [SAR202 cluster bacterium]
MRCPNCGDPDSRVTDSRDTGDEIRRRRECAQCGVRFTTYERVQRAALMVVKRDGRREEFNREKLIRSIRLACVKRPLPTGVIEKVVDEIESDLQRLGRAEVPATVIGEATLDKLREIDTVAYIRYASVYRDFDDASGFIREIQALQEEEQAEAMRAFASQLPLIPNEFQIPPKPRARRGRRPSMTPPVRENGAVEVS